jgi:hypothetical protein
MENTCMHMGNKGGAAQEGTKNACGNPAAGLVSNTLL